MINHLVEITGTFQGDTFMEFFTFKGINGDLALSLQQSQKNRRKNKAIICNKKRKKKDFISFSITKPIPVVHELTCCSPFEIDLGVHFISGLQ